MTFRRNVHVHERLQNSQFSHFRIFYRIITKSGYDPKNFRGFSLMNYLFLTKLCKGTILYTVMMFKREVTCKNGLLEELEGLTVKLLRFNNHIIHTNDIDNFSSVFDALAVIAFSTGQTTLTDIL